MALLKQQAFETLDQYISGSRVTIIVAVSGGADSLALTLLAKEYANEKGYYLQAVTVDHKLRPESTAEANTVHQILSTLGVSHHTLTWDHSENINRRHERAREARYSLLTQFCKNYLNPFLLTAHHQQDQVETILMRFLKGSGPAGFRGIQMIRYEDAVPIVRPLLETPPEVLRNYLKDQGVAWIEDPSNNDSHYERTRTRQLLGHIKDLGWSEEGILTTAAKMYGLHETLENLTAGYAKDFVIANDPLTINQTAFFAAPSQIQIEYLRQAIWQVGAGNYPKPYATIEAILDMLKKPKVNGYQVAGCIIEVSKKAISIKQDMAVNIRAQLIQK